jgi:predicted small lipoprotein YifL
MSLAKLWAAAIAATFVISIAGCEKQGPLERAGEEVDEAVDTVKRGEESTATKVDDTIDEAREAAEDDK